LQKYIRLNADLLDPATEKRKMLSRAATSSSSSFDQVRTKRVKEEGNSGTTTWKDVSEPEIVIFGEDWLVDPNCVGSSVAALGQESSSDSSNRDTVFPRPEHDDNGGTNRDEERLQGWTDSELSMARLLYAMREQHGDNSIVVQPANQQPAANAALEWVQQPAAAAGRSWEWDNNQGMYKYFDSTLRTYVYDDRTYNVGKYWYNGQWMRKE